MGVPPHLVAGGLSGVVAQRLVRTFCRFCRGRDPEACTRCSDGYSGRTGVFQVLAMNDAIRDQIMRGASTSDLGRLASESGMASLTGRREPEGGRRPHFAARGGSGHTERREIRRTVPGLWWGSAVGCPRLSTLWASDAATLYLWSRGEKEVEVLRRLPATGSGLVS